MIPPFCANSTLIDPAGIGNRRFGEALKFATGTTKRLIKVRRARAAV
jgi:hypothetical protein